MEKLTSSTRQKDVTGSQSAASTALLGFVSAASLLVAVSAHAAPAPETALRQAEGLKEQQAQQQKMQAAAAAPSADEPPETYPGENKDLGPQLLLKQKPKAKPLFEFSSDTMLTWTSNALSDKPRRDEAAVVAQTLSLAVAPEAYDIGVGKLSLRSGYRHLIWVYDIAKTKGCDSSTKLNDYNFEMSTFFLGSSLAFNENWNASLGLDYNRILTDGGVQKNSDIWGLSRTVDPSWWTETYTEWNPNWSLSRTIPINDKMGVNLSYNGGFHFTNTDPLNAGNYPNPYGRAVGRTNTSDKLDNGLSASLMWSATKVLLLSPSVRFTQNLYTQPQGNGEVRRERSIGPGLNVMFSPSPRWSARLSLSGEFKHSNDPTSANYVKYDVGTAVSVTLKF